MAWRRPGINVGLVYWCIYVPLSLNELVSTAIVTNENAKYIEIKNMSMIGWCRLSGYLGVKHVMMVRVSTDKPKTWAKLYRNISLYALVYY